MHGLHERRIAAGRQDTVLHRTETTAAHVLRTCQSLVDPSCVQTLAEQALWRWMVRMVVESQARRAESCTCVLIQRLRNKMRREMRELPSG